MTNKQHSITPPDELVQQWRFEWINCPHPRALSLQRYMAAQASQWGWEQRGAANEAELQQRADQELKACEEWVEANFGQLPTHNLHQFRRSKPPSLQEQALDALQSMRISPELIEIINANTDLKDKYETILRALETL